MDSMILYDIEVNDEDKEMEKNCKIWRISKYASKPKK